MRKLTTTINLEYHGTVRTKIEIQCENSGFVRNVLIEGFNEMQEFNSCIYDTEGISNNYDYIKEYIVDYYIGDIIENLGFSYLKNTRNKDDFIIEMSYLQGKLCEYGIDPNVVDIENYKDLCGHYDEE